MIKNKKRELVSFRLLIGFSILVFIFSFFSVLMVFNKLEITGFASLSSYEDYTVYIFNNYELEDVSFVIPIENKNEETINKVFAEIEVLDSNGNRISFFTTNNLLINPHETGELKGTWENSGFSGNYQVRILLFLDDETYSFSKLFSLDKKVLSIENIFIEDFKLGEEVSFSVLVENHLDTPLNNVSTGILILDDSGEIQEEIRSLKNDLGAKEVKKIMAKWNTREIESGNYNARLIVDYDKGFVDRDLVLNVREDSLEITGVGYSIAKSPDDSNVTNLLIFLVLFLVLTNVILLILYKKKSKK